ncbi:MAG: TIGR02186 family protein [Micropepsaceae bacterium]
MRFSLATLLLPLAIAFTPADAEELAAGISRDKVEITSNFTGADVVVFGAIESEAGEAIADGTHRDIVIVVRSDQESVATVRKKELMGPIWVNRETRQFAGVPGFYFIASSRPLKDIAAASVLQQFELGLENLALGPAPGSNGGPPAFRQAFLDSRVGGELYGQHEGAVTFMSGSLFRTTTSLPPNVPAGNLRVLVYAFKAGRVVSSNAMTLFVDKTGIERQLSDFAQNWPVLYGFVAVIFSMLAGFSASVAFRERS